ncbi:MAG: GH1 family beta-glucosidase [Candidatus Acidiferrales bacterium]
MSSGKSSGVPLSRRKFLAASAAAIASTASVEPVPPMFSHNSESPTLGALTFPKDFLWGASTSAYQIEGAAGEDGRAPSIWDEFCKKPGAIWNSQTGAVACDHYHRYAEDVAWMREVRLRAYRFSISWPRVIPQGKGDVNPKGLDFYSRLLDELLRAGIAPFVTLFHWDYPLALENLGGWLNRDAADWFADYAAVVARALSDRVHHWLTLVEPRSFVGSGFLIGEQAPGYKLSLAEGLRAGHNLMRAHGKGVQAIRANSRKPCEIGFAPDASPALALPENPENIAAAHAATFSVAREYFQIEKWWHNNSWWLDPAFLGEYPADGLAALGKDAPEIAAGDMETIHQPLDFFAINIYGGNPVRAGAEGKPEFAAWPAGWPLTGMDWEVTPDALYWGPKWLYERYKKPLLITENGLSCRDWISLDGCVHDPQRIDFTSRYLRSLHRAMQEGISVRGYFHWSLLDNFEWAQGFKQRFGLIFVDYPSQRRVLKDSARWYAKLIASNGAALFRDQETCAAAP